MEHYAVKIDIIRHYLLPISTAMKLLMKIKLHRYIYRLRWVNCHYFRLSI